ncbi:MULTISPECIES: choice-of-anchor G family protein [Microbacterium]|uniref:choice-of-anchor G family protein n=1 Tax=Microbacterium TaxID=33882 RepID=UPI000CFD2A07|nr:MULTISPECIES: choice-of-anchor G family protein [unclassified Microbacterium]PRB10475.1 hypothetical protein CQ047_06725 [Microbacterium sp. MYb72]
MNRLRAWLAVGAVAILAVPVATSTSLASWRDAEWAHAAPVGTSSLRCGTDTGFSATSAGRQVSGTLLGTDLDTVAAVNGVRDAIDGALTETYSPAQNAHDLDPGSTTTFTRATSLNVGILPAPLATVSLPTIQAAVPDFAVGTLSQYSQVTPKGLATGATGAVTNQSGIATIGEYGSSTPPRTGSLTLNGVLGSAITSNLTNAALDIGAVSALSRVDGCDVLREATWDVPAATTAVARDYDIAGLDLTLTAPVLSGLVGQVDTSVTQLQAKLNGLQASLSSGITGVLNQLHLDLGVLSVSTAGSGVSVTNIPQVAPAVSALLAGFSDADGIVTLSPRDGLIRVNLARLLNGANGLNDLAPNTQFLLTPAVLTNIGTRVTNLVTAWRTQVISALTTVAGLPRVKIDVSAEVKATVAGIPPLIPDVVIKVADVKINLDANLGALHTSGTSLLNAGVSVTIVDLGILTPVLGALLTPVLALLNPLVGTLRNVIKAVVDDVFSVVTALDGVLAAGVPVVANAVAAVFGALAPIFSLYVNVQPDRPNAPPVSPFIPATSTATAEYKVTALRIGLLDALLPTSVNLGTASAGPISLP